MSSYFYKTNGEEVRCVNCGNMDFTQKDEKQMHLTAYECNRCHFVSWFPGEYAPGSGKAKE